MESDVAVSKTGSVIRADIAETLTHGALAVTRHARFVRAETYSRPTGTKSPHKCTAAAAAAGVTTSPARNVETMSEGSKMGLFGSKDQNQEQKEKSSKDNSPARYAPYGVDSDTETYDTEALSMMDINDIIGVQSGEQIGDSTLESEIAALSQIITESKIEPTFQSEDLKPVMQQDSSKVLNPTSSTVCITSIDNTNIPDESSIVSKKCTDNVHEMQKETSDFVCENKMHTELSIVAEDSVLKNTEMDFIIKRDKTSDVNTNEIVDDTSTVCTSESSSNDKSCIEINLSTVMSNDTLQGTAQSKQQVDAISPTDHKENIVEKIEDKTVNKTIDNSQNETKSSIRPVVAVGGISKSLQLIGEAYNSEDSEETDVNDSDSPKETSSLSVPQETSLPDVFIKQHEDDNSEVTDILQQNTENSSKLNDSANTTVSEESNVKVENIIDNKIADSNVREPENSNQSETLQQILEMQENIDNPASNKITEHVDNGISSCTDEQSENNTEIKVDTTERTALEHQSSNEVSKETADTFVNTSSTSSMEIPKNIDESEENEIEIESSISTFVPETEMQDSSTTSSEKELSDTRKVNDCPVIDDAKEIIKNVLECEDKDAVLVSANKTQESTLTEISDKELNMTEVTSKNNDSQETDEVTNENSQTTHEIVSITDKINDDSQEIVFTQKDLEETAVISDNQDNVDVVNAKETSVPTDKDSLPTASDTTNKELVVNEDTLINPDIEEKNAMANVQSTDSNLLSKENLDLCSKNLIKQSDPTPTDANNSEEINVCTQEDILEQTLGTLIQEAPVEHDNSDNQLPLVSEKINDTTCSKFEELHSAPISHEDSSNTIENINKPETEEIEDVQKKIPEAVSSTINKDQNETPSMENEPQQIFDRSESCVQEVSSCTVQMKSKLTLENVTSSNVLLENDTNLSLTENLIVPKDDVPDYVCNTIRKEDKVQDIVQNVTAELLLNKTAMKVSDLDEEKVKEIEKNTEKEDKSHEMGLVSESIPSQQNVQINPEDINLQDDEETKLCENTAKSKESIDVNATPIIKENNVGSIVEESTDANLQSNIIDISLLQESSNEKMNTEKLTEKLSQDSENMDVPATTQTVDALEGLLDMMPDNENSSLKDIKTEDKALMEEIVNKNIDMDLLLDQANQNEATMTQSSDYITNVIASCLTNRDNETSEIDINAPSNDKTAENEDNLKMNEDVSTEPVNETDNDKMEESLGTDSNLQQNDLDMDFENNRLESVDLEESEAKLELSQDILLEGVMQSENLSRHTDTPTVENSQSSSEISELESAVKFLQESEEQTIDSLVLSPKMVESVVEDITKQANAELYVPDEIDNYANESESELAHLRDVAATDSISISEAEIISEAAKLENERKFAKQMQNVPSIVVKDTEEINEETEDRSCSKTSSDTASVADSSLNVQTVEQSHEEKGTIPDIRSLSSEGILKACELIPRVSILEERLKEPPKIEIPIPDSTKVLESSISPNDSLLIPKDARAIAYSRMLESPKSIDKIESKSADTPRKDSEKHSDFENVGSPRIILKIAKSAITDCSEPRSPKSPKIRSATNSPNPEDSPGQKLGKIKLKLSKGGHPSIISNENLDEINQWHTTENTSSLSPIGMKIKLSKSGDASIVSAEKHESPDDSKETKYKIEEPKRTDSPIGMKIKLSKSGDASIISDSRQQDAKEALTKHKEKLEIPQGSPKRTESPIGMKFKLSKTGDASIIQTDRQESLEEHKEVTQKRTDSPIGMKIKLSKTGDASIVSPDATEDSSTKVKEKQDYSELPKRTESPIGMKIKLSKCKGGASIISVDNTEEARDKLEVPDPPKRTESPLGMKIKLSKTGDASIIHSEVTEDVKEMRYKDKSEVAQDNTIKTPESSGIKIKMKTSETASSVSPNDTDEQDVLQGFESSTGIPKIKVSKSGDTSIVSNKTDSTEDSRSWENQAEVPKKTSESSLGMKIKLSKSGDASIVQNEAIAEEQQSKITRASDAEYSKGGDSSLGMKIKLFKTGDASVVETPPSSEKKDKQRRRDAAESPLEMKIKLSKTGHPTIVTCDSHSESSMHKGKDPPAVEPAVNFSHRYMEHTAAHKESPLKIIKTSGHHPSILQSNRSELTIEPVQVQSRKQLAENAQQQIEISSKRKDVTISPVESKKSKLETQLSQILPEVTIQPVMCRDQKQQQQQQQQQLLFDPKTSLISRQQMNVINQEISITQVRPDSASDKFKDILCKNSPGGLSDCEIIEHRPELIIVNENSNSSQDVVIIEEVTPNRITDIKVPKKRGRPRRNPVAVQQQHVQQQPPAQMLIPRDPLALDEVQQVLPQQLEHRENERPKRTCRSQKSYAPPKRGRGRGLFLS